MDEDEIEKLLSSLQGKSDHDLLVTLNLQMKQTLDRLERGDRKMLELDARIGCIEKEHAGKQAIAQFLDSTLGRIVTVLTGLSLSAALICVYVVPVIWKVLSS